MKVLESNVAVVVDTPPTETKAGILLPGYSARQPNTGVVKHVGPRVKDVKVGDHIVFNAKGNTMTLTHKDTSYLIIDSLDVVATL